MRMVIIAVAVLLVLGGGGAGAYFYFFNNKAEAAVGEEQAENKADHDKKGGHGEAKTAFVELDPLILPVIDNTGVSQVVSLIIALEVPDESAAEEVKRLSPRLKDAYIQDMYGALNKHVAMKDGVIQVDKIKGRLNKVTMDVLGEEMVSNVLLQVVQQRPI